MIQINLSLFCVVGFQDNSIYLNFCGEICIKLCDKRMVLIITKHEINNADYFLETSILTNSTTIVTMFHLKFKPCTTCI